MWTGVESSAEPALSARGSLVLVLVEEKFQHWVGDRVGEGSCMVAAL